MNEFILATAQFGVPAVMCGFLLWRQRESERECQKQQTAMWAELVRVATALTPRENK